MNASTATLRAALVSILTRRATVTAQRFVSECPFECIDADDARVEAAFAVDSADLDLTSGVDSLRRIYGLTVATETASFAS